MRHLSILAIAFLGSCACAAPQADFPSVSPEVQQERDSARKEILATELSAEQAALAAARAAQSSDPLAVRRHELNIAALQRELGGTGAVPGPRMKVLAAHAVAPRIEDPAPYWDVYRRVATSTRKESP